MAERDGLELDLDPQVEAEAIDPKVAEALLARRFGPFDLLRERAEEELQSRGPEWGAFSAQVDARISALEREEEPLAADARAIASFRRNVESEIAELEPRFEGAFFAGVERRIWRAAQAPASFHARAAAWLKERWVGVGLAAAIAGGVALVVIASGLERAPVDGARETPRSFEGQSAVSVERVSFEGTVTVMAEDGMTVMWLADASG